MYYCKRSQFIYPLILILCLSWNFGISQIPQLLKEEVQYRVKNQINPSIAVALTDSTGTHYYVHGWSDLENDIKANTHTLYELGSITKSFTGLLLAKFAVRDSLLLCTPINDFLPDSIDLSDKKGTAISLVSLATHSGGLPRLPSNLDFKDQFNPYKNYDQQHMYSFLSHHIPRTVDRDFVYSNLGFGLLGDVLAAYKNTPYQQLLQEEILNPLQLKNTFFKVPKAKKAQMAKGYLGTDSVPLWEFKVMDAAGGLKADIKDLHQFGQHFIKESSFSKIDSTATSNYFTDKDGGKHGLGWFIDEQGIVYHGGGTGGFRTFIAIDKANRRVISVMTNSGSSPVEDLAKYLIDPKAYPLQIDKKEVAITAEQLEAFKGTYINDGLNLKYTIVLKDKHLHAQLNGQPEFPLYYQGEDSFIYKAVKAKVVFEKDENNTVIGLLLHQNGQEIQFIKTNP